MLTAPADCGCGGFAFKTVCYMKIMVFPRKWFQDIKGTNEEVEVFRNWNVVSIITPAYGPKGFEDESVPFSLKYISSPNVLVLKFHDADRQWNDDVVLMTPCDADRTYNFVQQTKDNGRKGYMVHCTAGKSRSQAFGYVLNEYFNGEYGLRPDAVEYNDYESRYADSRVMNSLVKRLLMERFFDQGGSTI